VPEIKSLEDLRRLRQQALEKRQAKATTASVQITAFMGTCGIAAGAREVVKAILDVIESKDLQDILIKQTGCIGLCAWEPIIEIEIADKPRVRYGKLSAERAERIMELHVIGGNVVDELVIPNRDQEKQA
jgi:NADP-reducing hydrogenase subunit HndB